ncbi:MAG: phage tail protein I [Oxalobacter sp.]|nr:phage tail protein I [Oxalobacter sp.]
MNKQLETITLSDILPPSILIDANMQASGLAVDPELRRIAQALDTPVLLKRIDSLTSAQLDHLSRQYDATWRDSWPISRKRSVLKATIANKRLVGTVQAVRNALAAISSTMTMTEWWQTTPKGEPHTFTITATMSDVAGGTDTETQEDLIKQIDSAKPVRSWYSLNIVQSMRSGFNAVGVIQSITCSRITAL